MIKTLILFLSLTGFIWSSIVVRVDIKGIENKRLFYKTLKEELLGSNIRLEHWGKYTLRVKVKGLSDKKHQKIKIKYKFYNDSIPFASGDIDARYSIDSRNVKRYIIKSISQKVASKILAQKSYMYRHLEGKTTTFFDSYDFDDDKRVDFVIKELYGKDDMAFFDPKSGLSFYISKVPYNMIRGYNIDKLKLDRYSEVIIPGNVIVFKTSHDRIGKLKVLKVHNSKISFKWKWL